MTPTVRTLAQNYNTWLRDLFVLQVVCSAMAIISLTYILIVEIALFIPTASCPEGRDDIYLPHDQLIRCFKEIRDAYFFDELELVARISVVGSLLSVLSGVVLWLATQFTEIRSGIWQMLRKQLLAIGVAFILHSTVVYPFSLKALFNLVVYGNPFGAS